jgi:hypothetical protein
VLANLTFLLKAGMDSHKDTTSAEAPAKQGMDWEDFFKRRKRLIIGLICIGLAGLAGYELGIYFGKQRLEKVQAMYQAIETTAQKEAFVEEAASETLGGFVALELANTAFEKEDWERSEHYYLAAIKALRGHAMEGLAWIGLGNTRMMHDPEGEDSGYKTYEGVLGQEGLEEVFRAQAAYRLAVLAIEGEDFIKARLFLSQLDAMSDASSYWKQKGALLRLARPEELKEQSA